MGCGTKPVVCRTSCFKLGCNTNQAQWEEAGSQYMRAVQPCQCYLIARGGTWDSLCLRGLSVWWSDSLRYQGYASMEVCWARLACEYGFVRGKVPQWRDHPGSQWCQQNYHWERGLSSTCFKIIPQFGRCCCCQESKSLGTGSCRHSQFY